MCPPRFQPVSLPQMLLQTIIAMEAQERSYGRHVAEVPARAPLEGYRGRHWQ